MPDIFVSAYTKLARAKRNLATLKRRTAIAIQKQTYKVIPEAHPNKPELVVYKMRLTKQLPDSISELTMNVVKNLREALDHELYAIAVAAGSKKTTPNAHFPFSGDSTTFENNLKGRCADIPRELWPLIRSYEPYKGGSDLLFALNEICNSDKHAITAAVGTTKFAAGVSLKATGFFSSPYPRPTWDSEKNEMELFTLHRTATQDFKANFNFASYVAFGKVGIASGKEAISNLTAMVEAVETILGEIKAECRKLGFVDGQLEFRNTNHIP